MVAPFSGPVHGPGAGPTVFIAKTADEVVAGSSTLQDDNELYTYVGVGTYLVECELRYVSDSTRGVKATLTGVTASTIEGSFSWGDETGAYTSSAISPGAFATADTGPVGDVATSSFVAARYVVTVTAGGTLKVQWAQSSAAGNTTVRKGSWLRVTRVQR